MILDRMEIEEAGPDPAAIADAVHAQMGRLDRAIPVHRIAAALDIREIRAEPLVDLEGALVMPTNRDYGVIVTKRGSGARRQRFTIAHELGHYLNIRHQPGLAGGFACTRVDLGVTGEAGLNRHLRQEAEANRFAIDLLAPTYAFAPLAAQNPSLAHVTLLADHLELSRQACTRRYVELQRWPCAAIFSTGAEVSYSVSNGAFPARPPARGRILPALQRLPSGEGLGGHEPAEARPWGLPETDALVVSQTLRQQDGHAITLLIAEPAGEAL